MREAVQITLKYNFVMYEAGVRTHHAVSRANLVAGADDVARNSKRAPGLLSSTVNLKPCKLAMVSAMLRPSPCPGVLAAPLAAIKTVKYLCPLLRGDADARVAYERKWLTLGHPGLDRSPRRRRA